MSGSFQTIGTEFGLINTHLALFAKHGCEYFTNIDSFSSHNALKQALPVSPFVVWIPRPRKAKKLAQITK